MSWEELTKIALTFIVSLGGGGAIVLGLANWIGKILADRYVEKVKQDFEEEIERHKTRLRKSEFLFQKEFDAASAFISLQIRLLPRYRIPEMDWHDACEDFARSFDDVEKAVDNFIATHGAALPSETLKFLINAKTKASRGRFEVTNGDVSQDAVTYAKEVMESLDKVEKKLYQVVRSQTGT